MSNQQGDNNLSTAIVKVEQNQVLTFKNVKTKVKTWFNKKIEQIQTVIPFDFNDNQGRKLAIVLMAVGFVIMMGWLLPMGIRNWTKYSCHNNSFWYRNNWNDYILYGSFL